MELQIDIELQDGLMLVTARGTLDFKSVSRVLEQVWDAAAVNQVRKILVDGLATEGELAAFERYDLGVEAAADLEQRRMNVRLAFVGVPPAMDGFGVRIARNRGVVTRIFSSQEEALSWLAELPG
jgi:hypothetical protein